MATSEPRLFATHEVDSDTPRPVASVRAKPISRTAERAANVRAASYLDHALAATGISNAVAGEVAGVCPTLVREFRLGLREVSLSRILEMPASVARAVLRAALTDLDDDAPVTSLGHDRRALRIADKSGAHAAEVIDILSDGMVDEAEVIRLERSLLAIQKETESGLRDCRVLKLGAK